MRVESNIPNYSVLLNILLLQYLARKEKVVLERNGIPLEPIAGFT